MNQFKEWEIHDDKGLIFKGRHDEMVYAWNINYLNDKYFKELYGHVIREPKWKINQWQGDLKLIRIEGRMHFKPGAQKLTDDVFRAIDEE